MGELNYHSLNVIPKHLSIVCSRGGSQKPTLCHLKETQTNKNPREDVHPFIMAKVLEQEVLFMEICPVTLHWLPALGVCMDGSDQVSYPVVPSCYKQM